MKKIETIVTKVTAAILLKDEQSSDKRVVGDVYIKVPGLRKKPIRHYTGYFFLIDTPKKFNVIAGGELYKEESFLIDLESPQSTLPIGSRPSSPKLPLAEIKLTKK